MVRRIPLLLLFWTAIAQGAAFDHRPWDALLAKHVVVLQAGSVSQVDYRGMAADHAGLQGYLDQLALVSKDDFDGWPASEQLAFLINAYNAWTVELILTAYPDLESIRDLGTLFQSPWKKRFIPLLGATRSLDDIEHGLIRGSGRYEEPRIHFAVNCASIGCPALGSEAYRGEDLDGQLEQATRLFLADRDRNRLTDSSLQVSSIFKWYREDFSQGWRGADSLGAFFYLYRQALGLSDSEADRVRSGAIAIEFLDYDWRLNAIP